jgi:hypothetical protein
MLTWLLLLSNRRLRKQQRNHETRPCQPNQSLQSMDESIKSAFAHAHASWLVLAFADSFRRVCCLASHPTLQTSYMRADLHVLLSPS